LFGQTQLVIVGATGMVGTFGTRPGWVSCYLLRFLLADEPRSEVQTNLKRLSKRVLPSMAVVKAA